MLRKKALSVCFINEKELWNKNGSQVRQRLYTERLVHQQHFNGSPSFLLLLFWYSNFNRKQKREPKYAARIYTFYCKLCYAMLCSFPLLCHDLIRHPETIYSFRQKKKWILKKNWERNSFASFLTLTETNVRAIVIWISSEFTMLLNLFLFIIIYYFRSLFPLILSSFPCSTHTIGVNNIECWKSFFG